MITKQWYARNNTLIALIVRAAIITTFVFLFQIPQIAGIIMLAFQLIYCVYFIAVMRFTKIRYFIFLSVQVGLTLALIFVAYMGAVEPIQSATWSQSSTAYIILFSVGGSIFAVASLMEMIIQRNLIMKQIKSIYLRFIKCERTDAKIIVSKYD